MNIFALSITFLPADWIHRSSGVRNDHGRRHADARFNRCWHSEATTLQRVRAIINYQIVDARTKWRTGRRRLVCAAVPQPLHVVGGVVD